MLKAWMRGVRFMQPNLIPSALVVMRKPKGATHPPQAINAQGISHLTEYRSAVGSLSTASTRRQRKAKQPLGVVATGLGVWARSQHAPQADKLRRVGNLKLMPLTNPAS